MFDTATTVYSCAPTPYRPLASAPSAPVPGTGSFVSKKERLWKIEHGRDVVLPKDEVLDPDCGTTILLYEFVTPEYHGSHDHKKVVEDTIREWEKYANVKFVAKDESNPNIPSDIRIQFGPGPSSWGYIGPSKPTDKVTVYLGGLPDLPTKNSKAIILHEFGHVLGMLHEHQSPVRGGDIILDEDAVYEYFGGGRRFLRQQIINVFNHLDSNFSEFDRKSIMMYPLPAILIQEGKPVEPNVELSPLDKAYIQLAYPHNSSERLLNAMGTIGIPESDALNIIKPLMKPADTGVKSRLEEVRDTFFDYNKKNIEAKALLKSETSPPADMEGSHFHGVAVVKEARAARRSRYRR